MNRQSTPAKAVATSAAATTPAAAPDKALSKKESQSLVRMFAARYAVDAEKLLDTLKDTAFKQPYKDGQPGPEVTNAQMMALLVVANEYQLNPFTREIYAFPAKGGGIVPIISVDGWIRIINSHPELKSIDFEYAPTGTPLDEAWIGCTIDRKDRDKPLTIREYYGECYRKTEPWDQMPRRMLRHKALIQCARIAFGYAGVFDPDEADRIRNAMAIDSTAEDITHRGGKQVPTEEPRARLEQQPNAATVQPAAPAKSNGNGHPQQASMLADADPVKEIRRLLDVSGVPENELFGRFEVGGLDQLSQKQQAEAIVWLNSVNRP